MLYSLAQNVLYRDRRGGSGRSLLLPGVAHRHRDMSLSVGRSTAKAIHELHAATERTIIPQVRKRVRERVRM